MIKNKSTFCIKPFTSCMIASSGRLDVCCWINSKETDFKNENNYNIKNNTIEEWWNSEYLDYLRQNFLEDKKPKECNSCWNEEDAGLISGRNKANDERKSIFKNNYKKNLKFLKYDELSFPIELEIQITNVCNLKCQMCTGKSSSKLLIENNKLGYEKLNQKDYNFIPSLYEKLEFIKHHDVEKIDIRGGEPFYNKMIIEFLEKLIILNKSKKILLHITSNGTIFNDKIKNLLEKFLEVRLMFSVESVEKYNEYIRYPSNWNNIKKNILEAKKLKNCFVMINTIVQNLNILYLPHLIEFAHQNEIYLQLVKLVRPTYLDFRNLPLEFLKNAEKNLSNIDKKKLVYVRNFEEILLFLQEFIKKYKLDIDEFKKFSDMIKKRDEYRKISIADYMPEIYNII